MTKEMLFESLQYVGDDLLAESEKPARPRRPWLGVAAAAACLCLIAGLYFGLPRQDTVAVAGVGAELKGKISQTPPPDAAPVGAPIGVPGSVNGPMTQPDAVPTVLAWNELEEMPSEGEMFFAIFGKKLTAEQFAACRPEIQLEWMDSFQGHGQYFGTGDLYCVMLTVEDPAWDGRMVVQLRDRDGIKPPASPYDEGWTEEPHTAYLNEQAYRAYRFEYDLYPGQPHVWMCVVFEKENVEYTLRADAPAEQETQAAADLRDLLLAYAGTHYTPDLGSFRGEEDLFGGE